MEIVLAYVSDIRNVLVLVCVRIITISSNYFLYQDRVTYGNLKTL